MSRDLSFEYNAALAISKLVVDRIVGALYDGQAISDTHTAPITGGTAHLLISKPRLSFDANRQDRNAVLTVDSIEGLLQFTGAGDVSFESAVEVQFRLVLDEISDTLRPDFSDLTTADVTVTSDNSLVRTFIPPH